MARSKYWMFNLSEEDHAKVLAYKDNKCAMCESGDSGKLNIDHDHKSGLVRGPLCFPCNRKVGDLTLEFAEKIVAYLKNPPATLALGAPRFGLPGRVGTKEQRKLYNKLLKIALKQAQS